MFKNLILGGTKFCCQFDRCPQAMSLKVSMKKRIRGSDPLKTVLALRTRTWATSFTTELAEVKDHGNEMHRSKDQSPKHWGQTRKKWNRSTGENSWREICQRWQDRRRVLSMESKKDSYTKGDACSYRCDENKRGKSTRSFSLAPKPQTKSDGNSSLKGKTLRGRSLSGKRYQRPCTKLHQWKLFESVMWFVASSRMSTSHNTIGMQIRWRVRLYSQGGRQPAQQEAEEDRW